MRKKSLITTEQLVLFVLNNSKPNIGIKKVNKLAFLLEFTYIFEKQRPLTDGQYAAINMGPVINDYKSLMQMLKEKKVICVNDKADEGFDDYLPLVRDDISDTELVALLKTILKRYEDLSPKQLEDLTHGLDSYNITIHENDGNMGSIIDKDLGMLDSSLSLSEL